MKKLFSEKLFFSLILLTNFNNINYSSRTASHPPAKYHAPTISRPPANTAVNTASLATFKTYLGGILTTASTQFGSISSLTNNNNNRNNNYTNIIMQIKTQIDSLNTSLALLPDINSIIVSVTMALNTIKTTLANSTNQYNNNNQNNQNNNQPNAMSKNNSAILTDAVAKISSYITDFILNITGETNITNLQNYFNGAFNPKALTATNTKPISVILDYIYNIFTGNSAISQAHSENKVYPYIPKVTYRINRLSDIDEILRTIINYKKLSDDYLINNNLSGQVANNEITLIVFHRRYFEYGINLDGISTERAATNHDYNSSDVRANANLNEIRTALLDKIAKNYPNSIILFIEFNSAQFGSMDNSDGSGIASFFGLNDTVDGLDFHPSFLIYSNIISKLSSGNVNLTMDMLKGFLRIRNNATLLKRSDIKFDNYKGADISNDFGNYIDQVLKSLNIKVPQLPANFDNAKNNMNLRIMRGADRNNNNNNNQQNNNNQNQQNNNMQPNLVSGLVQQQYQQPQEPFMTK